MDWLHRRWRLLGSAFVAAAPVLGCGGTDEATANSRQGVGGTCAADGDCQEGLTCETDDPGGQCVKACASDADCGAGNVCSPGGPDDPKTKCYRACSSASDCTRSGYGCVGGQAPRTFCDPLEDGGKGDAGS